MDGSSVAPRQTSSGPAGPQAAPSERSGEPRPGQAGEIAAAGDRSALRELFGLFVYARQVPPTARKFGVAAGISAGACPLVHVDPEIDPPADLVQQTQKVFGLAMIRRRSTRTSGVIASSGRPVHVCLSQLGLGV
jgi:hypothetical protein